MPKTAQQTHSKKIQDTCRRLKSQSVCQNACLQAASDKGVNMRFPFSRCCQFCFKESSLGRTVSMGGRFFTVAVDTTGGIRLRSARWCSVVSLEESAPLLLTCEWCDCWCGCWTLVFTPPLLLLLFHPFLKTKKRISTNQTQDKRQNSCQQKRTTKDMFSDMDGTTTTDKGSKTTRSHLLAGIHEIQRISQLKNEHIQRFGHFLLWVKHQNHNISDFYSQSCTSF